MINWTLKKLFGSKNARLMKSLQPVVARINDLERQYQSLSDDALRAKALAWKKELSELTDRAALDARMNEILPDVFAAVKNAARRMTERKHEFTVCDQPVIWNMVHFDVQLIGGICLHRGMIAEMATGEGKTLVATLPLVLNGLSGRGAHLVTTNDYLARRDGEWMGQIYQFLGLTLGIVQHDQPPNIRRAQYECDITYGVNAEFGFDYLRDNGMAQSQEQQVQRGYSFAIVDEVDSILIDEARVPLIIAGPSPVSTHQYDKFKPIVDQLVKKQFMLCNRLVSEAEAAWEKGAKDDFARLMVKVKFGQPRNRGFLRAMEDADRRRVIEKLDTELYGDAMKEERYKLKEELFFTIEERQHEADLTEEGRRAISPNDPDSFTIPDIMTQFAEIEQRTDVDDATKAALKTKCQEHCDHVSERIHNISQLLRAYCLYEIDVHYVVEDGKVVIVDEFTGRKMSGRRWSDGLHQAVEAKEGVHIDRENQTLATITIQNYFRLYKKLAGMTGTAETDANELMDVYKLEVAVIPTNRPCVREDLNDLIFKTRREKYKAVVKEIVQAHARKQPVLVGTISVEQSEVLSRMLKLEKVPHAVLNAKYHQQEAEIIARAGQPGSVTISTNMAGRGTDIKLGAGVAELGGLYVVATERHESRRIDRQLRGRCARQGDPGQSRFYVSFEDDLMRHFGQADRMTGLMERFGMQEGEALEHSWLNKSVETAQKRVEQRNYLMRKRSLEFDDVLSKQREVIYGWRNDALSTDEPRELVFEVIEKAIPDKVFEYLGDSGQDNPDGLVHWVNTTFPIGLTDTELRVGKATTKEVSEVLMEKVKASYEAKCRHEDPLSVKHSERYIILNAIDQLWQEHLYAMDAQRESVFLRAHAQKDPLIEYKQEAYGMFTQLMSSIDNQILGNLFRSSANLMAFEDIFANLPMSLSAPQLDGDHGHEAPGPLTEAAKRVDEAEPPPTITIPVRREIPKVGRNDPCPCGSGRKYKNCCGKAAVV